MSTLVHWIDSEAALARCLQIMGQTTGQTTGQDIGQTTGQTTGQDIGQDIGQAIDQTTGDLAIILGPACCSARLAELSIDFFYWDSAADDFGAIQASMSSANSANARDRDLSDAALVHLIQAHARHVRW